MGDLPEIDLTDPAVVRDPFTVYGEARERSPLARLAMPGFGRLWLVTRHAEARDMLGDPRFALRADSYMRPDVPEDCLPYMRTMGEMDGPEHTRLRRLVSPAFTARRAGAFRPRIEPLVDRLLDGVAALPERAGGDPIDLVPHFTRPLPMDVICELVGIPEPDHPRWREYGATVAASAGPEFAAAIPGIMAGAKAAVESRRTELGDDVISDLVRLQAGHADQLTEAEMVTLIWHLVIAGQTPANLVANAVAVLLSHPGQLAAVRADPALMPRAVEEIMRWGGPALLSIPRFTREDVEIGGTRIPAGEPVTVSIAAANRDPRVFEDPDRFDVTRAPAQGGAGHLGFSHGPHFCLGASLARVETEVALSALLRRFPGLALAAKVEELRAPDPGNWRLSSLPVTL
ncbi:cytochrome P450 family protein [Spirillospora sp. CA-255316]